MKTLEMDESTRRLVRFARRTGKPVFLTDKGETVAAVMLVSKGEVPPDSLLRDEQFVRTIERSRRRYREEAGISDEEMRRRFGLESATPRSRRSARTTRRPKSR